MNVGLESVEFVISAVSAFLTLSCLTPDVDYQTLFLQAPGGLFRFLFGKQTYDASTVVSAAQSDSVISSLFLIALTLQFALVVLCPSPNASQTVGSTLVPSILVFCVSQGGDSVGIVRLQAVLSQLSMLYYTVEDIKMSLYRDRCWSHTESTVQFCAPLLVLAQLTFGNVDQSQISLQLSLYSFLISIVVHTCVLFFTYRTMTSPLYCSSFPVTERRAICSIISLLAAYSSLTYPYTPVPVSLLTSGLLAFPFYFALTAKYAQQIKGYLITLGYITACYCGVFKFSSIEPFTWLYHFLLQTHPVSRPYLFIILFSYVTTVLTIISVFRSATEKIIARKFYHIIMVPITYIGILDSEFLIMALSSVLLIQFTLEPIRSNRQPGLGAWQHDQYTVFTDSRDQGVQVLTHMYLFLGQLLPVVISTYIFSFCDSMVVLLPLLTQAGTAVICVGDSFATIGGKALQGPKWPSSTKTFSGSLVAAITIALYQYLLCMIHGSQNHTLIIISSILAAINEAITSHVDNLILPLQQTLIVLLTYKYEISK